MVTRVVFPQGSTTVRLEPMYQWDYGRQLEIDATGISTVVEVHFACRGMTETIAYACSVHDEVITVPIPTSCLEQTSDITAWVYEYKEGTGKTTREITIPIIQRTRPPKGADIPQSVGDRYSLVIEQMNDVVDDLRDGTTPVKRAESAKNADMATAAKNAESANFASSASYATTAGRATKAVQDEEGSEILTWYLKNRMNYREYKSGTSIDGGLIEFRIESDSGYVTSVITNLQGNGGTTLFSIPDSVGKNLVARLNFTNASSGVYSITVDYLNNDGLWARLNSSLYSILYQYLSTTSNAGSSVGPSGGVVKVGTSWVVEEDVNNYEVTVTGGLSVYQDSMYWEVTAERVGTGTVTVTYKPDGLIVSTTTYTIVTDTTGTGGGTGGTTGGVVTGLPAVSPADNGKILGVMNGVYTLIDLGLAEGGAY